MRGASVTRVIKPLKIRRHPFTHMWIWTCERCRWEGRDNFSQQAAMKSALAHCAGVYFKAALAQSATVR